MTTTPMISVTVHQARGTIDMYRSNMNGGQGGYTTMHQKGYRAIVRVPQEGQRPEEIRCCYRVHRKARNAYECGLRTARALKKETGIPVSDSGGWWAIPKKKVI